MCVWYVLLSTSQGRAFHVTVTGWTIASRPCWGQGPLHLTMRAIQESLLHNYPTFHLELNTCPSGFHREVRLEVSSGFDLEWKRLSSRGRHRYPCSLKVKRQMCMWALARAVSLQINQEFPNRHTGLISQDERNFATLFYIF